MLSFRHKIRDTINFFLSPLNLKIITRPKGSDRPAWELFPEFLTLAGQLSQHTLLPKHRLFALWQWASYARSLPGCLAEVGVYRGGASYLMASISPQKEIHLFDTFSGLPEADMDRLPKGAFHNTSVKQVRDLLSPFEQVFIYEGFFPDTAEGFPPDKKFCLVHLDGDLYPTTKDGLEFFYPRLVPGGVIVLDDYLTRHQGVTTAVDEFVASGSLPAIVSAAGQSVIIKQP